MNVFGDAQSFLKKKLLESAVLVVIFFTNTSCVIRKSTRTHIRHIIITNMSEDASIAASVENGEFELVQTPAAPVVVAAVPKKAPRATGNGVAPGANAVRPAGTKKPVAGGSKTTKTTSVASSVPTAAASTLDAPGAAVSDALAFPDGPAIHTTAATTTAAPSMEEDDLMMRSMIPNESMAESKHAEENMTDEPVYANGNSHSHAATAMSLTTRSDPVRHDPSPNPPHFLPALIARLVSDIAEKVTPFASNKKPIVLALAYAHQQCQNDRASKFGVDSLIDMAGMMMRITETYNILIKIHGRQSWTTIHDHLACIANLWSIQNNKADPNKFDANRIVFQFVRDCQYQ
jgi:hypothetical protein